jgi:hypothetical protein
VTLASLLGSRHARLEGLHHVDDARCLTRRRRELELLPCRLLGDQVEDLDPVVVFVLRRVELGGQ